MPGNPDGFGGLDQLYVTAGDDLPHDSCKKRVVRTSQNDPVGSRFEHRTKQFSDDLFRFRALFPILLDQLDESLSDLSQNSDPVGIAL